MPDRLRITLTRSPIGLEKSQGATARGLGLRRMHQTVEQDDSPAVRGMLHKIRHLVRVETVPAPPVEEPPARKARRGSPKAAARAEAAETAPAEAE